MFFDRFFGFGESIGIDLGTATVLVYIKGRGIVLREPSVVTIDKNTDTIIKLECNIDDMTGEEISFAEEMLFSAGARDVFTVPIYMKKNRG